MIKCKTIFDCKACGTMFLLTTTSYDNRKISLVNCPNCGTYHIRWKRKWKADVLIKIPLRR